MNGKGETDQVLANFDHRPAVHDIEKLIGFPKAGIGLISKSDLRIAEIDQVGFSWLHAFIKH